jgi:ankyrin repeat protein
MPSHDEGEPMYDPHMTAALAREELDGAHVEGDAIPTAPAMRESSSGYYQFNVEPGDPSVLLSIIEEAIPKNTQQNAPRSFENEQQRDLLDLSYEKIRRWLWSHNTLESRQAAVYIRGQNDSTPLHLLCKLHNPPADIVQALVEAAPEICGWTDAQGWLPLHHACNHGVSPDVLTLLIQAFPEGKLQTDHQNRTALHFYVTRNTDNVVTMALNAEMLSNTGAAAIRDVGGMLPIHYASAYGTHSAVLEVLVKAYPESVTAVENHGRTPMHLAMVNAHRDASPGVIQFLLDHPAGKQAINSRDKDGHLPLHLMALGLKGYKPDDRDKKSHVSDCLEMYLAAEPVATADFLTAIQDLPDWLQDTAVVSKHVRNILNDKIVQRFPTSILMLDGMFLFSLIVCFAITTQTHIDLRLGTDEYIAEQQIHKDDVSGALMFLYVGAGYFVMREIMQMGSLMGLNSFAKYFGDPSTWLDMTVIVLVLYYAITMSVTDYNEIAPDDNDYLNEFRTGVAVTQGILWAAIIVFLKSTLVDFAVFVGGLFNVAQRLVAFLIAVSTILLAFAQMFYFVYLDTDICEAPTLSLAFEPQVYPAEYFDPDLVGCSFPHCQFGDSLLKVYTMMMGEIGDETRYSTNLTAQILFVGFAFLVVILLSNVLIAIVTDSYEIIQNDRAAIVFWSNRLDFVAETDAIAYAIQRRLKRVDVKDTANAGFASNAAEEPKEQQGTDEDAFARNGELTPKREVSYFYDGWHQIMMLFDENLFDDVDWLETCVYNVFRFFCVFIIIPLWLTAGLVTAGWLWPPQVREYLFAQRDTVTSRSELERKKLEKLKNIQVDLKSMKQEITKEMANDRIDMARMKAEVETIQNEVLVELMQLRELMGSLIM